MATEFGRRLKEARKNAGLTQKQLAPLAQMSQSNLSELETIAHGSSKTPHLAKVCGVNAHWLATGEGCMEPAKTPNPAMTAREAIAAPIALINNPDYPSIRRVRFSLSASATGFGIDYDHEGDDAPIVFHRNWYVKHGYQPEKLFAVRVANGSMETGLYNGDSVVVNTADVELCDGEVFACNYEGEMVIKRLVRDGGAWWLTSDNPDQRRYPRKSVHEGVQLLGRIIHKQSERI